MTCHHKKCQNVKIFIEFCIQQMLSRKKNSRITLFRYSYNWKYFYVYLLHIFLCCRLYALVLTDLCANLDSSGSRDCSIFTFSFLFTIVYYMVLVGGSSILSFIYFLYLKPFIIESWLFSLFMHPFPYLLGFISLYIFTFLWVVKCLFLPRVNLWFTHIY